MNIDPHLEIREYPERDQSWKLTIPWPQKKKTTTSSKSHLNCNL